MLIVIPKLCHFKGCGVITHWFEPKFKLKVRLLLQLFWRSRAWAVFVDAPSIGKDKTQQLEWTNGIVRQQTGR